MLAHKVFIDKVLTTETCTYDLCSLATHIGPRPESGHYMAYRRDAFGFVKLDDHNVAEVLPAQEDYFRDCAGRKGLCLVLRKERQHRPG